MAGKVAVLATFLSLIFYAKITQASVPDNSLSNTTLMLMASSHDGPAENIPINWTASWERLGDAVSLLCFQDAYSLFNNTVDSKTYAGNAMNNTGRADDPEEGLVDHDNFSECNVAAMHQAMYCTVSWTEKPKVSNSSDARRQGLCAPMSCSEMEVALLVKTGLLGIKPTPSWTPRDVDCERIEDDGGSWGAMSIIPGIAALSIVIVGTMYEFIVTVYYTEERKRSLMASKCGRFLVCFSVYSNTKKVFNPRQLPGQLSELHGIRVLSCLWIILGHVDYYANFFNIANRPEFYGRYQKWPFFVIDSFNMGVDTFLVLSAFLVTHWFLKQLKKRNGEFTWGDLGRHYLHRYWRLTPVYLYLLLLALPSEKGCRSYIWANLLYINNYFMGPDKSCMGVAWYLGVDMQMFIIAPALILVMYKKPKLGVTVNISLVILSWVSYGALSLLNPIAGQAGIGNSYFWTPCRMGPYIMGMLLAYLLFRTNSKVPNTRATKVWMLLGWAVGITLGLVATMTPTVLRVVSPDINIRANIGWESVERSIFSAGVCWVIYACCVGYGGIISEFLSWTAWLPLSRLSYVAYLMHTMYIFSFYGMYESLFYDELVWVVMFAGLSFWTFVFGFILSVTIEVPFCELGKMILPQRRGRQAESVKAPPPTGAEEPGTLPLQAQGEHTQNPEEVEADITHVENKV
ncbi:O-acyltransferase like protein-like isoform X2 [Branchiostoma floridae x Branchiostoma japonicum]